MDAVDGGEVTRPMRHLLRDACSALLVLMLASASIAQAKTFRWSSQGDVTTLDPHGNNEGVNNHINNMVYEYLVRRDKADFNKFVPGLAVSWTNPSPNTWIFKLRQGVKFHDGTPFTADDVVFSFDRALASTGTFSLYSRQAGKARKIDSHTVEFVAEVPNPVMMTTLVTLMVVSKSWCEKNGVTRAVDFRRNEESYASRHSMGTGPYILVSREPGVKIVHRKNPEWWGIKEGLYSGNADVIEYRPITNAATRMAALKTGELDFVLDPSLQDVLRLRSEPAIRIWEGEEFRVLFIGFDQSRTELQYSDVKGRNPFKDRRVRLALYQAIDINAIKSQVMRGMSVPTGLPWPGGKAIGLPPETESRHPYDPVRSRQLLAEAGYPKGFAFTLTCPNDRYVNDEKICIALAAMWAKVGVNVRVDSMVKANFFVKMLNSDTSAFLVGWGGSPEAIFTMKPILHSKDSKGNGESNYGRLSNPELDALIDKLEGEMNPAARLELTGRITKLVQDEVLVIPLHRQVIPWASRRNVEVIHRPDNLLPLTWVTIK